MTDLTAGLTGTECAVLLVLAAESGPVRNPDLKALGATLEKPSREKLRGRGLIEVTIGARRANIISLSDKGWAATAALLEAEPPAGAAPAVRALFTFARGIGRYLRRESLALGELLLPETAEVPTVPGTGDTPRRSEPESPSASSGSPGPISAPITGAPTPPPDSSDLTVRIWNTYHRIAPTFGAWVSLKDLRAALGDLRRQLVDDALKEMYILPGVDIAPEMNQKALTAADRQASLTLGGRQLFAMRVMA
jgi:hypothetical protein